MSLLYAATGTTYESVIQGASYTNAMKRTEAQLYPQCCANQSKSHRLHHI